MMNNIFHTTTRLTWAACFALAGLFTLASCSDDNETAATDGTNGINLTFQTAFASGNTAVKAIQSDGGATDKLSAYWAAGDTMTIMLDNNGTRTLSKATVTPNSDDNTLATVHAKINTNAANGNTIYAFYPGVGNESIDTYTFNYTLQDGTLANVAKLDPRMGTATLNVGEGNVASLNGTLTLSTPVKFDASDNVGFGSCYFGVKAIYKGEAIKIKSLTIAPLNPSETDSKWVNRTTVTPKEKKYTSDATYYTDPIKVNVEEATTERIYVAYPIANNGQAIRFTATTEEGETYTVNKTFSGTAGHYYPVTLQMNKVGDINFVDLGTDDDIEWGDRNIGSSDPEDYGDYFSWGETTTKPYYSTSNYKWAGEGYDNNNLGDLKKYNDQTNVTLESDDDVATAVLGSGYRMPTREEIESLLKACESSKEYVNGVLGLKLTSKTTGNSIFFPTTGYMEDGSLVQNGDLYVWSSQVYNITYVPWQPTGYYWIGSGDALHSVNITKTQDQQWDAYLGGASRYCGLVVRPVKVKSTTTTE